jgi:hypothetical protein
VRARRNGLDRNSGHGQTWGTEHGAKWMARGQSVVNVNMPSYSAASTEASLSENSSHGGQTPPKARGKWCDEPVVLCSSQSHSSYSTNSQQPRPKQTRRSNRRKNGKSNGSANASELDGYVVSESSGAARREVVTMNDLCFDFGPTSPVSLWAKSPSMATTASNCQTIGEDHAMTPISPCRARSGPSGITSTNPCTDIATTIAPASTRIPDLTRSRFCPLSQTAPPSLDLRLCTAALEPTTSTPVADLLGSPCRGRMAGSTGVVSATPCNTPTCLISAALGSDASARRPPSSSLASSVVEPGQAFSPCQPRVLFPRGGGQTLLEQPEPASSVGGEMWTSLENGNGARMDDALRSWLQSSGLPSGAAALQAELRAAAPEAYED